MKLISIIIPVYNLENYVGRALDSIFSQEADGAQYEVVAVDDGSTDKSLDILQKYAKKYDNFRFFHQENHGVSVARNLGLKEAKGQYVTFLDGDDEFFPNSLNTICSVLKNKDVDVLYCNAFVNDGSSKLRQCHGIPKMVKANEEYTIEKLGDFLNGGSVCGGFYKTEFLREKNMVFAENIKNSEDTIFNYMLYSYNPRIMFIDSNLYMVHVRQGSASRSASLDRAKHYHYNIDYLVEYMQQKQCSAFQYQYLSLALFHSIGCGVSMLLDMGIFDACRIKELLHINRIPVLYAPKQLKLKKLQFLMLNHCFPLYLMLFKLRKKIK